MSIRRALAPVVFAAAAACSGSNGEDSGVIYQKPQVLPDVNPLCLNMMHIEVGKVAIQPFLLQNNGRETLVIEGAEMFEDERMHFSVQGPDNSMLATLEFASFQLRYAPTADGWDAAAARITSNAENYPTLDVYIVALAEPAGLDGGSYDPGPRPERARDACLPPDSGT
jgi:hypothetical protein